MLERVYTYRFKSRNQTLSLYKTFSSQLNF